MSTRRLIARLDIKGENVVRGIHLEGMRVVGKPLELAERYAAEGADEIVFVDTVASLYGRNKSLPLVGQTAERVFIPMTVGGGIRSSDDVAAVLRAGGDKITLNSAAVRHPPLIEEIAREFGSQCVVLSIECKRIGDRRWTALIENGREPTGRDVIEWARQAADLGAGEILLTSIDQDGTKRGFDIELTRRVVEAVPIPVIASGGAGHPDHLVQVFTEAGASAVALGAVLHFGLAPLPELRAYIRRAGIDVRIPFGAAA